MTTEMEKELAIRDKLTAGLEKEISLQEKIIMEQRNIITILEEQLSQFQKLMKRMLNS